MPRTIRLPDALDGGKLVALPVPEGGAVAKDQPIAVYELEGRQLPVLSDADGTVLRLLGRPGLLAGGGAPVAIVGEAGEVMGYEPTAVRCVRLLVQRRCSECGSDYPVNGLVDRVQCTRCGELQITSASFWREYLAQDVKVALEPGQGSGGSVLAGAHGPCTRQCWGIPPLCRKCVTLLEWNALVKSWDTAQADGSSTIHCGSCGEGHRTRPPPAWALDVFPGLVFLVGETAALREHEPSAKPVVFKCPSCLAPLQVDGVRRIIRCRYCESDVYLPDDLWLHLNPAAKRARWWMLFRV